MDAFIDNIRIEEAKRYLLEAGLLPEEVQDSHYMDELHEGVAEELQLVAAAYRNGLIRKIAVRIADRARRDARYEAERKVVRRNPGSPLSEHVEYENIDEFEAREGKEWRSPQEKEAFPPVYYANTQMVHDPMETVVDVQVTADTPELRLARKLVMQQMLEEIKFRIVTDYGWEEGEM